MPIHPAILIADDDAEDLELIGDAIRGADPGIELHAVTTGKAVVDYLEAQSDQHLPTLIILDYNMPELNGVQVLSLLGNKARYKNIRKVVLSTSSAPLRIHESTSNGASDYFVKPNNAKDLNLLAKKLLALCHDEPQ